MSKGIWEGMKTNHAIRGFATIITGIIITVFLWWFFNGFGFWALPGIGILFIGVAETFYTIYGSTRGEKSTWIHAGLLILFVGVAGYISFASHVMLGTLQIFSLIVTVIGLMLLAVGIFSRSKT